MGADFRFRYSPDVEGRYEVEEAASDFFVSLFDADMELLEALDLLPIFVKEYREQTGQTSLERAEESSMEELEVGLADLDFDPEKIDWEEMEWGPSAPFEPEVARAWALEWIDFIREADAETLGAAFPYTLDLQTGKSTLQKRYAIEDLEKVIAQAECAAKHRVQLTVEAIWG